MSKTDNKRYFYIQAAKRKKSVNERQKLIENNIFIPLISSDDEFAKIVAKPKLENGLSFNQPHSWNRFERMRSNDDMIVTEYFLKRHTEK